MISAIIAILYLIISRNIVFGNTALVSVYGDWGVSASGSLLHKYPIRLCMENKRCLRVYPAAVHTDMVKRHRYKVFQLQNPKTSKSIFVHITDECSKNTHSCSTNHRKAKRVGGLLIDLHQMGMKALGMKAWSLYKMKYNEMGKVVPQKMSSVLSYDGKKRYVPCSWKLRG